MALMAHPLERVGFFHFNGMSDLPSCVLFDLCENLAAGYAADRITHSRHPTLLPGSP